VSLHRPTSVKPTISDWNKHVCGRFQVVGAHVEFESKV